MNDLRAECSLSGLSRSQERQTERGGGELMRCINFQAPPVRWAQFAIGARRTPDNNRFCRRATRRAKAGARYSARARVLDFNLKLVKILLAAELAKAKLSQTEANQTERSRAGRPAGRLLWSQASRVCAPNYTHPSGPTAPGRPAPIRLGPAKSGP